MRQTDDGDSRFRVPVYTQTDALRATREESIRLESRGFDTGFLFLSFFVCLPRRVLRRWIGKT